MQTSRRIATVALLALPAVLSAAEPVERRFVGYAFDLKTDELVDTEAHRDHRYLMRYEGMSNIKDEDGDNYVVRIEFPVAERSVRPIPATSPRAGDSNG